MFIKKMKLICKAQGRGQAKGVLFPESSVLALTPRAGDRKDSPARTANHGCSSLHPEFQ